MPRNEVRPEVANQGAQESAGEPTNFNRSLSLTGGDNATPDASAQPLSKDDARRLTTRIRRTVGSISGQLDKLVQLVREARDGDAHLALGYKSWTEYVAAEFAELSLRWGRTDRRDLVELLSGEGMSARAIAPVVGASEATVRRDISGASNDAPEQPGITGLDGKRYERSGRRIDPIAGVSHETVAKDLSESPVRNLTHGRKVAGRDGKTHTRRKPKLQPAAEQLEIIGRDGEFYPRSRRAEFEATHALKVAVREVSRKLAEIEGRANKIRSDGAEDLRVEMRETIPGWRTAIDRIESEIREWRSAIDVIESEVNVGSLDDQVTDLLNDEGDAEAVRTARGRSS